MKQMGGMGGGGGAGGMPGMGGPPGGGMGGMDMEGRLSVYFFNSIKTENLGKKVGIKSNQSTFAWVISILYIVFTMNTCTLFSIDF